MENEILFVSSYPPRECGIATYTQDLIQTLEQKFRNSFSAKIVALNSSSAKIHYPAEVKYVMDATDKISYVITAEKINKDKNIKLIFLQHEFGLYNGKYGEDVLSFIYTLNKPLVIGFHTVLPNPDKHLKRTVNAIADGANKVVVMTNNSCKLLHEDYGVPMDKISVIHHGTHLINYANVDYLKEKYSLQGKIVLATFGLIGPGKSIETALNALPAIVKKYPNTIYLIIGKTHPEIVKQCEEQYRETLESLISTLGITENVRFVNEYIPLDILLEYLQVTDIYLFTSKDPNQAVSGTLAYAMGSACPIISTPIPHAIEMLAENAGIIIDHQNSKQLSEMVLKLLDDPKLRTEIGRNAMHKIRPSNWQNSAIAHAELYKTLINSEEDVLKYSMPEISIQYLQQLTTSQGVIQFSDICKPDINSGYTLDDNARALIALVQYSDIKGKPQSIELIRSYLYFIVRAWQPEGKFLNYVDLHGNFTAQNNEVNLEDSMGRALWALGEFIKSNSFKHSLLYNLANDVFRNSLLQIPKMTSPRAISFSLKGLCNAQDKMNDDGIKKLIIQLADKLVVFYNNAASADWDWFENHLTYANSVIPEALLMGYQQTNITPYKVIAKKTFDFLLSHTFDKKQIKIVSNNGWFENGKEKNNFGEQPIDAAYTILTLDLFYSVLKLNEYKNKMNIAFSWFHGNNRLNQIVYNPANGGCSDGLEEHNVNLNQGAESTVCYLLARLVMEKYETKIEAKWFDNSIQEAPKKMKKEFA